METNYYFEKFKNIQIIKEKSRDLENICAELETFTPKIEDALNQDRDLDAADKHRITELNIQYTTIMSDLNTEYKQYPK